MDPLAVDVGPERDRRSIVELLADRVLDPDLAALVWLLVEKRTPLVVAAGPSGTGKTVLLRALLAFLPPDAVFRTIAGAWETWDWLPGPTRAELGVLVMPRDGPSSLPREHVDPEHGVLVVPEFSPHLPTYAWGPVARTAIRLGSMGYGLAATVHAESLAEVFDELGGPGVGATADELSALGLVLVMAAVDGRLDPRGRRRVVAAHYVRPLARDVHGHLQRLNPAVLATWDPATDAWEDFSWAVLAELAPRLAMRTGDLEGERDRRAAYLRALVAADVRDEPAVVSAIRSYGRPAARA